MSSIGTSGPVAAVEYRYEEIELYSESFHHDTIADARNVTIIVPQNAQWLNGTITANGEFLGFRVEGLGACDFEHYYPAVTFPTPATFRMYCPAIVGEQKFQIQLDFGAAEVKAVLNAVVKVPA